jgi:DNA polymerase-3 subunit beta
MKAEFLVENVESFLPTLSKILPLHSQIPVLSNILIEATKSGLFFYATNLELGIRIKIPAKIEEEGATTVPGKQFIETLSAFPKDKITISFEKERLTVSARGNRAVFQTIPKEEFPTIYEEKGEKIRDFDREELKKIFSKMVFAVSTDETRPELTGILVAQKNSHTDFVATDGFRLSLKRLENSKIFEEDSFIILPARAINEALTLRDEKISLYLYKKSNQIILETEDVLLVGRIINGEFPNYERVIPQANKTDVHIDREEFLQKIRLSSVFARDAANIVKIRAESGKIKIFAQASGLGEGEATMDVEQKGENNEIAFNVKFLSDILKNIDGKTVTMQISSPVEPAVFKVEDDKGFTHIIMPVRVQE